MWQTEKTSGSPDYCGGSNIVLTQKMIIKLLSPKINVLIY